jgi:hypothetical protein
MLQVMMSFPVEVWKQINSCPCVLGWGGGRQKHRGAKFPNQYQNFNFIFQSNEECDSCFTIFFSYLLFFLFVLYFCFLLCLFCDFVSFLYCFVYCCSLCVYTYFCPSLLTTATGWKTNCSK